MILLALVLCVASLLAAKLYASKEYWRGRDEGWKACEGMVCRRIEENYPDHAHEVWSKLVQ